MDLIKRYTVIFSAISSISILLILVIKFLLNFSYSKVERRLGIKKNNKLDATLYTIHICVLFLFVTVVFYIKYDKELRNAIDITLSLKYLIISVLFTIILYTIWIYSSFFVISKYIDEDKNFNKLRYSIIFQVMFLVIALILNSSVAMWYITNERISTGNTAIVMLLIIINLICITITFGNLSLKNSAISLKYNDVYFKNGFRIERCKILYTDSSYTWVIDSGKNIGINNSEILKIQDSESNLK